MSGADELFPITQASAEAAYDFVFAPWVKQLGLHSFTVREGYASARFPENEALKFSGGGVCGQALMASIDTLAAMAASTTERVTKGTTYQHTHFLRPAKGDDFLVEAQVVRWGKATAYIDARISFVTSGELVAHAVLEFAF